MTPNHEYSTNLLQKIKAEIAQFNFDQLVRIKEVVDVLSKYVLSEKSRNIIQNKIEQ